ncbi:replication initiator protein A [Streptococcus ovuberis]|uniref:Replication initiator A N-terminal domain-containing protein n=1 Tax=Streptococcus ovuberis TaxID=1936207 RepID=A0A7X6MYB4_9STRE|nr:replication initiator protein A [Streptococcus ovuberis]NKZ19708.1 hypothetical protein [Streptococcus ovuberis]
MADITIDQLETQTFYQIPQIFMSRTEKEYGSDGKLKAKVKWTSRYARELSNDAKLTYAILYNRCLLSIRSYREGKLDFVDDNGSVFLIFTVEDLMDLLDRGKTTVLKLKKELTNLGLLREVSQGANRPNRIYLQTVDASLWEKEYYVTEQNIVHSGQGNRAQTKVTYIHTKTEDSGGKVIFQAQVKSKATPDILTKGGGSKSEPPEKPSKSTKGGGSKSEPPEKPSKSTKSGGSKSEPPVVQNLNPTKIENTNIEKLDNSSSRKAEEISKEIPQPAKTEKLQTPSKSSSFISNPYYNLLQVIADRYNGKFSQFDLLTGEFQHYNLTHHQKMLIATYLENGYVTSEEVLGTIERIPYDCQSPLAYLLKSLNNLETERKLEVKIAAHRRAETYYQELKGKTG